MYNWGVWTTRVFVRDSFKSLFPASLTSPKKMDLAKWMGELVFGMRIFFREKNAADDTNLVKCLIPKLPLKVSWWNGMQRHQYVRTVPFFPVLVDEVVGVWKYNTTGNEELNTASPVLQALKQSDTDVPKEANNGVMELIRLSNL